MTLLILSTIKNLIFINLTGVEFNSFLVFLITSSITMGIIALINQCKCKYKGIIALAFYGIISLVMFSDLTYYRQFGTFPSVAMLGQVNQLLAVEDTIRTLIDIKSMILILDIPILIIIYFFANKRLEKYALSRKTSRLVLLTSAVIFSLSILYGNMFDKIDSLYAQELYLFHVSDILNTRNGESENNISNITAEYFEEIKERTNLKEGKLTGVGKGKNLLVIQVESLQNFLINFEYNNQEITPNLNSLIGHNSTIYYDKYYQLIGRGNTSDAEFVTNNSLHPAMDRPSYSKYQDNTFYGLPWLLRDKGYTAWVMHGYKKEYWNRDKAYINQGFQRFLSEEDYIFNESIGFGIKDEDFFQQSIDFLRELDDLDENPFYAFLITLTSHSPFKMPEEYNVLDIEEEHRDTILGDYLQSVHYTDKAIGKFIEDLKEAGLYENTIIALYGDHFGIQSTDPSVSNMMTDLLGFKYDYDTSMNVPLIIHIPDEEINETNSNLGSALDFYPTILNIMGYKNEKGLILGKDLNNMSGENYVFPHSYLVKGSVIGKGKMLLMARDGIFHNSKLYDLYTRGELAIDDFRHIYDKGIKELNISEFILNSNLLKYYGENKGELDINIFSKSNILNGEEIAYSYFNSLEDLDSQYDKGIRIFAVDIERTADEKIILLKDWYWYYNNVFENPFDRRVNLDEFNNLNMRDNKTQMGIDDLIEWMKNHNDAYIIFRHQDIKTEIFTNLFSEYPYILDKGIVEIRDFQQYLNVTYKGFDKVILNISNKDYTEEEVLDFISTHTHIGVFMDKSKANKNFIRKLREFNVEIYLDKNTRIENK